MVAPLYRCNCPCRTVFNVVQQSIGKEGNVCREYVNYRPKKCE